MKIRLATFLYLAVVILAVGRNVLSRDILDYKIQLRKAVKSFSKLLDFMNQPRQVVGDMIFGFVLAEAQLSILKKNMQNNKLENEVVNINVITALEQKCEAIFKIYFPEMLATNRSDYNNVVEKIVKKELWEVDFPIKYGQLKMPSNWRERSDALFNKSIAELVSMGTPSGSDSDECINELTAPTECTMSEKCKNIMTSNIEVHGYPLTHRLLYFLIAERMECSTYKPFTNLHQHITDLCSNIMIEMYHLLEINVPPRARDLFIEQVDLCGMEGFAEFLNPLLIDWIINQQVPTGCFTQNIETVMMTKQPRRKKRDDGYVGDSGCTMHITGLSAPFFVLNIRALVEYWIPKQALFYTT